MNSQPARRRVCEAVPWCLPGAQPDGTVQSLTRDLNVLARHGAALFILSCYSICLLESAHCQRGEVEEQDYHEHDCHESQYGDQR